MRTEETIHRPIIDLEANPDLRGGVVYIGGTAVKFNVVAVSGEKILDIDTTLIGTYKPVEFVPMPQTVEMTFGRTEVWQDKILEAVGIDPKSFNQFTGNFIATVKEKK